MSTPRKTGDTQLNSAPRAPVGGIEERRGRERGELGHDSEESDDGPIE